MRNIASKLALAAVLAAGLATPVLADVDVTVTVNKTKTVTINELLTVNKDINIDINVINPDMTEAAEAMAIVNHTINDNTVDRNVTDNDNVVPGGINNLGVTRSALILGSVGTFGSGNVGVTGVNQDVGVMANQGNIWSVAVADDDQATTDLFTDAQTEVSQDNVDNRVEWNNGQRTETNNGELFGQILVDASIAESINDNAGLTAVNQNAGNMNNQANALSITAGLDGTFGLFQDEDVAVGGAGVALSEAALGQNNTGNTIFEGNNPDPDGVDEGQAEGTSKLASVFGSINSNAGVTQVNQAVSNMGNQGNLVAVGAAVLGATP